MCDFHDYTVSGPGGLMNRLCICMDLGSGVVLEQQTVKWVSVFSEKVHTASKADFFFSTTNHIILSLQKNSETL